MRALVRRSFLVLLIGGSVLFGYEGFLREDPVFASVQSELFDLTRQNEARWIADLSGWEERRGVAVLRLFTDWELAEGEGVPDVLIAVRLSTVEPPWTKEITLTEEDFRTDISVVHPPGPLTVDVDVQQGSAHLGSGAFEIEGEMEGDVLIAHSWGVFCGRAMFALCSILLSIWLLALLMKRFEF